MTVFHGPFHGETKSREIQGFGEIIVGPVFQGFHGSLDGGVGGHDDNGDGRVDRPDRCKCLQAGNLYHADIHKDQIKRRLVRLKDCFFTDVNINYPITPAGKQRTQHGTVGKVIVYYEDCVICFHGRLAPLSRTGSRMEKVVPSPATLVTSISPSWASMIR